MSTNVHLTPERQEGEERRHQFQHLLQTAEAEADRDGTFSLDGVLAEVDRIIDAREP